MHPAAKQALDLVVSVHGGNDPWHGLSTMQQLEGVSAADASASPAPGMHSIWQVVLHMTAWTREIASRLAGHPAKEPREGDWPEVGEPIEARWREAVADLDSAHREVAEAATSAPDSRWDTLVPDPRPVPQGGRYSHLETLEGLAAHHAYHGGQIGLLKKWLKTER
jgi:uncharacterized damage-inducible protein DinB